ncbi:MAG: KH domain-containing protein [Ruminococcus sp.]|nr:KH domain-containing protein [Candidatus Apopatosoma intestinale]
MVNLSETLADLARAIVDDPDSVKVTEKVTDNGTVVLELSVAPDDMGKVIGRQGRIAKAIRQLMKVAATNCDKKVTVDIR